MTEIGRLSRSALVRSEHLVVLVMALPGMSTSAVIQYFESPTEMFEHHRSSDVGQILTTESIRTTSRDDIAATFVHRRTP